MAKKKNVQGSTISRLKKSMKNMDVQGIAVVVLAQDGQIMIGSEGLDIDTCQSLLAQSADLMQNETGANHTLH